MVKHKESESESEDASHAEEPRFRISVCMKRFYSDERQRAFLCVCPRRRVRWLHRRLRRLFALPPAFRLLSRGHLLPPAEPLALLHADDCVQVVPVDTEPAETVSTRDVVDSVDKIVIRAPDRSPSPAPSDDLTETKRQALLMLEQYCAECKTEKEARPRRRRVRRRRRPAGSVGDCPPEPERAPPEPEHEADAEHSPAACREAAAEHSPAVCRESAAVPLVLRNDVQPRAPRVVRPLCQQLTASANFVLTSTKIFT